MQKIYDLNTEKLPPYNCFGNAVIEGQVYMLALARMEGDPFPAPLVICMERGLAWHGSWEFQVQAAVEGIKQKYPVH